MPHLRRLLEIFVAITILTLTVPSFNWQDNGVDNSDTSQSDSSGDQLPDQASSLGDFLLGESTVLYSPFQYELLSASIQADSENFRAAPISYSVPFLPHLFISESGLMPRAPALA